MKKACFGWQHCQLLNGLRWLRVWDSSNDREVAAMAEVALVGELSCTKICNSYGSYSKCVTPIWKQQKTETANSVCTYVVKTVILIFE
jgi:hypothetical protein